MEGSKVKSEKAEINSKLIPEVNIGLVGHVGHGKTSLTEALTGKLTLTHSEELKRGITIRLGYADTTIYKCKKCPEMQCYTTNKKCPICFGDCEIVRSVSFVDAPGHETLMATVLSGAALMDGAILIIAANEKCPQPQTREHLTALELVGIKNVIIVQNKIDLVSEEQANKNYNEIKEFVRGSLLEKAPIIPVSAQHRVNIDLVLDAIEKIIPTPKRDENADVRMLIARSFDINRPGSEPKKLVGGVLGGAVVAGKLKIDDELEIKPGMKIGNNYRTITTKVVGIQKAGINLQEAGAGGLLGIMTTLDPFLTKSDTLVGNIAGLPGKTLQAASKLTVEVKLLERVVGSEEMKTVAPIKLKESLMINVGTARSVGEVVEMKKSKIELLLKIPVCIEEGERIVISRQIAGRWRLIGYGAIHPASQ